MCGIAGIVDFNEPIEKEVLGRMLEAIVHRGPDDSGEVFGENFAAGMRRLSIIDICGGHQPIYNEDNSIITVFNGEIYNYIELRRGLLKKGHVFRTDSDTEVIVHLYEEYGMSFLEHLNGMFGIFIADLNKKEFYVIRDRFGIKPMYYSVFNQTLLFASETKSILRSRLLNTTVSEESIVNYFNYLYIPSPSTAYKEISKLEAGNYLKISEGVVEKCKWYDISKFSQISSRSFEDLSDEIRLLLEDSVRLQMRSDVPIGTYLSGGLDSSILTALAAGHTKLPVNTFSVGFIPSEFDELPFARQVSELYKTNHHELILSSEDAINYLPRIMGYMDEPIGDSAVLPSYMVSKLAVSEVKVVLSGLGGDELFGGYSRYRNVKSKFEKLSFLPNPLLKIISPLIHNINSEYGRQIDNLLFPMTDAEKYHQKVKQLSWEMICSLTGRSLNKEIYGSSIREKFLCCNGVDVPNQGMYTDIQLYMNDQLLHLTDRVSMAVSLEARVPFLDHRLVELSMSIPSQFKIDGTDSKIILKNAIKDLLPNSILNRPKWGFAAPYKTWTLSNAMKEFIHQTINGELISDGILDKKGVQDFLGNSKQIERYSTWVWPIVALELWYANSKKIG